MEIEKESRNPEKTKEGGRGRDRRRRREKGNGGEFQARRSSLNLQQLSMNKLFY